MTHHNDWRPSASVAVLRERAALLAGIRDFFARRGVLEVETPCLCARAATDPHLDSLETRLTGAGGARRRAYLHTSPESAMKRLLAAGSDSIYQICKVFRNGEAGRLHNPEFTLLEWYRCGYDHHDLMDEVEALIEELLGIGPAERCCYYDVFRSCTGLDLLDATEQTLRDSAAGYGYKAGTADRHGGRDLYLNFLMSHVIAPSLGRERPVFVYDFPATQAAMARITPGPPPLAARFELFINGVELANGYHELKDGGEQQWRFLEDNRQRKLHGKAHITPDERLLRAMDHGLPDCAGVAMGIDRLVMLRCDAASIADVLSFPIDLA